MNDYKIKELYEEMEKELISSMKRNLKRHLKEEDKIGFKYTQWQAEKLKELSRYRRQNKSIIGEYTSGINKEVAKHIQEEVKQGSINAIKQYNKVLGKQLKPNKIMNKSFFKTNDRKVNALIKVVNNDLKNANTSALRMINDQYRQVIHKSAFFVGNGAFTEQQVAKMATKELTDLKLAELAIDESNKDFLAGGLNCIQYKNGRRVNIASYSQMAVRTANLRAQLMGEGDFRKSIGRVLVQATSHGGACPICQKWEKHIFIDDVYSGGTKEDGKYMLLSEAMAQGFLHPNCRHGLTTYYPELENIENESEEEYQNDLDYINERMNYIDRNIKKYDRLSLGSLASENKAEYNKKVNELIKKKKQLELRKTQLEIKEDLAKPIEKIEVNEKATNNILSSEVPLNQKMKTEYEKLKDLYDNHYEDEWQHIGMADKQFYFNYEADGEKYYKQLLKNRGEDVNDWNISKELKEKYNSARLYKKGYTDDIDKYYHSIITKMPKQDINILHRYSQSLYQQINSQLRGLTRVDVTKEINMLSNIIENHTIKEDMILYRKTSVNGFSELFKINANNLKGKTTEELRKLLKGKEAIEDAFSSTSIIDRGAEMGGIHIKMFAPKGTKGIYINEISEYKDIEYEMLLQKGTKYKINDIIYDKDDDIYEVLMEVIND